MTPLGLWKFLLTSNVFYQEAGLVGLKVKADLGIASAHKLDSFVERSKQGH